MSYNLFQTDKQKNYPGVVQPNPQGQTYGDDKAMYYPSATGQAQQPTPSVNAPVSVQQPQQVVANQPQRTVQQTNTTKPTNNKVNSMVDPNDETSGLKALASLYTSPQEEERLRKASVANRRILAVGDALRHIGNIYNTVNYAPAQKLNSPVQEEETRYLRDKALRDQQNKYYLTYKQAKDRQDAQARQWAAQQQMKADQWNATFKYNAARDAAKMAENARQYNEGLAYRKANDDANRKQRGEHYKVMQNQGQQRINIAKKNADNQQKYRQWRMNGGGGNGSAIPPLDTPNGKITPSGRNYNNQLKQIWSFAEKKGLVSMSDVNKRLRELGFGKETPDNVKNQIVMRLLQENQSVADYARDRLGWKYNAAPTVSSEWDEYEEQGDENWDNYEMQ